MGKRKEEINGGNAIEMEGEKSKIEAVRFREGILELSPSELKARPSLVE